MRKARTEYRFSLSPTDTTQNISAQYMGPNNTNGTIFGKETFLCLSDTETSCPTHDGVQVVLLKQCDSKLHTAALNVNQNIS